jgi:hypothetical protein
VEAFLVKYGISFDGMFKNGLVYDWKRGTCWLISLLFVCWFLPNTQQIMSRYRPALEVYRDKYPVLRFRFDWTPSRAWALLTAMIFLWVVLDMNKVSEFLYFQF